MSNRPATKLDPTGRFDAGRTTRADGTQCLVVVDHGTRLAYNFVGNDGPAFLLGFMLLGPDFLDGVNPIDGLYEAVGPQFAGYVPAEPTDLGEIK